MEPTWSYWCVGQAIVNQQWLKENGTRWRSARIEVTGPEGGYPSEEYGIIYQSNPRFDFEEFVDDLRSSYQMSLDEIISEFRKEGGDIIRWNP